VALARTYDIVNAGPRNRFMVNGRIVSNSGKGIQLQNLPRPRKAMNAKAVNSVLNGLAHMNGPEWLEPWGRPLQVISDCLRGFVVAAPGHELIRADYSNIEGRVLAWLAGEEWKLDAFRDYDAGTGPDLYKLAYSRAFHVPIADVDDAARQQGKLMELGLGFGGGVGAFQAMAANYNVVVSDERADELKVAWRTAHPATVQFWYDLERAAMSAVRYRGQQFVAGRVSYAVAQGVLWCKLPSGRLLSYVSPRIDDVQTPWGETRKGITYMGVSPMTNRWERQKAYGGLFAENCTQGVARDVMAAAMLRVEARGWPVVLTVHDEIVSEIPEGSVSVEQYVAELTHLEEWMAGLPVSAEGAVGRRYGK
jgi:DNA polymerase